MGLPLLDLLLVVVATMAAAAAGWRLAANRRGVYLAIAIGLAGWLARPLSGLSPTLLWLLPSTAATGPLLDALVFVGLLAAARVWPSPFRSTPWVLAIFWLGLTWAGPIDRCLHRAHYASLQATWSPDGHCLQPDGSSCAPACALTIVAQAHGERLELGALSDAARTSVMGTDTLRIAPAIESVAARAGVRLRVREATRITLADLRSRGPAILHVLDREVGAHAIAYLGLDTEGRLRIADPLISYIEAYSAAEFDARYRWRIGRATLIDPVR